MTIGIDGSRANLPNRTGTEWYAFAVITRLMKLIPAHHRVVLYVDSPLVPDWPTLPAHWSVRVLRWPPKLLWTQLRLSAHLWWYKPDVLYIPAHTIPLIHPAAVVTVIHDVGFAQASQLYNDKLIGGGGVVSRLLDLGIRLISRGRYSAREQDYHRFAVDHARKIHATIITVSHFSQSEIERYYHIPARDIKVIYNGADPVLPITQSQPPHTTRPLVPKSFLLFIGRLEAKKNTPALIDLFAVLVHRYGYSGQLVLAGQPGYQYEQVKQAITTHHLEDHVIETGWVSAEQKSWLLHHAQAFIFPSAYEGFGIPVIEAFSIGTPVICSDIGALREVAGPAALFIDPLNSQVGAKMIHEFLSNREQQSTRITSGYQQARQFSWDRTASATWEILQNQFNNPD